MFILDTWGLIRTFLFTIDQVAYSLIDNAYDLINAFASASFFKDGTVETVMQNTYIIIGLFALFKIALLLVNALINPDKLFDKESGFAIVIRNVIIMFALLIFVPILFKESMNIQNVITEGSYINSLFGLKVSDDYNPGNTFKRQAIKALVKPNEYFAKEVTTDSGNKFEKTDACPDNSTHCKDAIDDYNEAIFGSGDMFDLLSEHMKDYVKVDDNKIYVYDYAVFLTFIVGVAITYLLIVFCFDLAERVIKLAILEIVSPLFIVTYIDPKSAKSGPFKNWLKEVGSTYVGLYIRLVALALILILLNLWDKVDPKVISKLGTLGTIIFILSILIFAKSFPKWLASLIGIKDFDNGIGGLGKRLGSAALVGGMLTKAGHAALGTATGAAKMVGENRRNRNALRKQARIDSGTTHGKKGHEFRKNYSGGYFAQRKALHDKRKEAYKNANANLLGKGDNGKNAVGRNLKQIGASIVGGAIVGGQAGIKADNIKGTLNAAKGAASQFGQGLGFQGRTIGGAINYGLENAKESISNAWGNKEKRYDASQEAEKAEKAIRYRASGTNYTHGVGEGTIGVGDKEVHKVKATEFATSTDGVKFEMKTDADKLAKQFAVTTGSTKIDTSTTKDGEKIYNFTGEDGKVITKTEKEIRTTCGGVLTAEGVDNFLKSSYNDDQNAVSAYNDNMQAQANAVSSYNQAQTNAQATANDFNGTLTSNSENISDALKAAGFAEGISKLGSSISTAIAPLGDAIEKLKSNYDTAGESKKKEINAQIELLSQLKQSADANQTFTSSAQTSMIQLQSIVESQKELAPIVNSVEGNTVAEKLQTLSRNSSAIEKRLKMYDKEKKD